MICLRYRSGREQTSQISSQASQKDEYRPFWIAELYVGKDGGISVNPITDRHKKNKWAKPEDATAGSEARMNELAHRINGRAQHYWFVGSRHRLTKEAIARFEDERFLFAVVNSIELSKDSDLVELADGSRAIPVDCPIDVAMTLHADITKFRREHVQMMGGRKQSTKQADELRRYFVSKMLENYMEDEDTADDIDDDFKHNGVKSTGLEEMGRYVNAFEAKAERLRQLAEVTLTDQCAWMDYWLFRIVLEGVEEIDEQIMIEDYEKCVLDLASSVGGIGHLNTFGDEIEANKDHVLHKYVFAKEAGAGPKIAIGKSLASKIVSIMGSYRAARLCSFERDARQTLREFSMTMKEVIKVTGEPLEVIEKKIEFLAHKATDNMKKGPLKRSFADVLMVDARRKHLTNIKAKTDGFSKIFHVVDMINIALSFRAFLNIPSTQSDLAKQKGIALSVSVLQCCLSLTKRVLESSGRWTASVLTRLSFRLVAFAAGILSIIVDGQKISDAHNSSDYDAAWAMTISIGSGIGTSLAAFAIAVDSSVAIMFGPIGIVFLVIGVLSYIAYIAWKDSELETFVAHCGYGRHIGDGSATPTWSPSVLSALGKDWAAQLKGLTAISRGFMVELTRKAPVIELPGSGKQYTSPATTPRLNLGAVDENTRFEVQWWWKTSYEKGWYKTDPETWSALSKGGKFRNLYTDKGTSFLDLKPPLSAILHSYYAGGKYEELWVDVKKIISTDSGDEIVLPFSKPVSTPIVENGKTQFGNDPIISSHVA